MEKRKQDNEEGEIRRFDHGRQKPQKKDEKGADNLMDLVRDSRSDKTRTDEARKSSPVGKKDKKTLYLVKQRREEFLTEEPPKKDYKRKANRRYVPWNLKAPGAYEVPYDGSGSRFPYGAHYIDASSNSQRGVSCYYGDYNPLYSRQQSYFGNQGQYFLNYWQGQKGYRYRKTQGKW